MNASAVGYAVPEGGNDIAVGVGLSSCQAHTSVGVAPNTIMRVAGRTRHANHLVYL